MGKKHKKKYLDENQHIKGRDELMERISKNSKEILSQEELDSLITIEPTNCDENNKRILNPKTIEALLECIKLDEENEKDYINQYIDKQVILYDFKRPNVFSKKQLVEMKNIHQAFIENFESSLVKILPKPIELQLHSVDQLSYSEYLMTLPNIQIKRDLNLRRLVSFNNEYGLIDIEINPSIILPLVEMLLGYKDEKDDSNTLNNEYYRSYITELDKIVFDNFMQDIFIKNLSKAFSFIDTNMKLLERKNIIENNEIVLMVVIELIIGKFSGMINIAYPYSYNKELFSMLKKEEL